ncbi:MAG: ATP-binding protein [Planctomycetaceae bacterium]|jgi:hypothetical protein|nr:ATP-binding protein [Planctomycetaceae bacterium]
MKKQPTNSLQGMLFEDNYLLRTYRRLTSNPDIALAELVANAWDAGASHVDINVTIDKQKKELITIQDDGIGMTKQEFQKYWRTLAYNRVKHQGTQVEFPNGKKNIYRTAYGRNGVGRHGLLCFGDSYTITSKSSKTSEEFSYKISLGSGENLLVFEEIDTIQSLASHGTLLSVQVEKKSIGKKNILQMLSRKFLHDPQFKIYVNDESVDLEDLKNCLEKKTIEVNGISIEMNIMKARGMKPGIAFWQGGRLIGNPSWIIGNESVADKRTKLGKEYSIIIKTDGLADYIQEDWSGFSPEKIDELQPLFDKIESIFVEYCRKVNQENYSTVKEEFQKEYFNDLRDSSTLVKLEFEEALREIQETYPTASKITIKAVLDTVIQLGKKRGGTELLQQLSNMEDKNIEHLNTILSNWTVQEIYVVLDEIDRRIRTIDAIAKLSQDRNTSELQTLHPLLVEARWVFGAEFDSPEYTSNEWLVSTAKKLFKRNDSYKPNLPQNRADIVVLSDSTISLTGTLHFDLDGVTALTDRVLLIELKRGGSVITRGDRNQITGYAEDIYDMSPRREMSVAAFLVGYQSEPNVGDNILRDGKVKIHVRTFSHIVDTATKRLFRLRDRLREHYEILPDDKLYRGILPGF